MKINLARSAGMCFGVRRAVSIALGAVRKAKQVYTLKDIVHNEDLVKELELCGIKKINKLQNVKDKILILPAHGTPEKIVLDAFMAGYRIIDATCPMVKDIHDIAIKMQSEGYKIIIIGDKKHDEVLGIIGNLKKSAIIIESAKDITSLKTMKKAAVVVQSTQNFDRVIKMMGLIKKKIKDLKFFNTVCKPTQAKQKEVKELPKKNGLMIIIGSKNSANTKRLYEISKSLNPRTYWINSKDELKKSWFRNVKSVGITAGASTPDSTIENLVDFIKKI